MNKTGGADSPVRKTLSDYSPARRVAVIAVMAAVAVILTSVESLVPVPVPAPGVKLGLANVITLILLIKNKRPSYAIIVIILRCLINSLFSGMITTLLFSLSGGLTSCFLMWFLLHSNFSISVIGISVAGAFSHNAAQLAAAAVMARDAAVFGYLPVLAIAGAAAGFVTGYIAMRVCKI